MNNLAKITHNHIRNLLEVVPVRYLGGNKTSFFAARRTNTVSSINRLRIILYIFAREEEKELLARSHVSSKIPGEIYSGHVSFVC